MATLLRRFIPQKSRTPPTAPCEADVEARLTADLADDDDRRKAILEYRTDFCSRLKDTTMKVKEAAMRRKAWILSLPPIMAMMTIAARFSFIYDFASDGQVGYKLVMGGHLWWSSLVFLFMVIPYLVLLIVLRPVVHEKFAALFGDRTLCITIAWLLFGIPFLFATDAYLNIRFLCSQPVDVRVGPVYFTGVELFHYMMLRKIVEFAEGFGQLFIQGYIWIRLWNPGGLLPDVAGVEVDPSMLLISIAFSVKGVVEAATFVKTLAKKQMRGDYVAFLKKMALLGEGLMPSVIYDQIGKHRVVSISHDLAGISFAETRELGRSIRDSSALEELSFSSVEFLDNSVDASNCGMFEALGRKFDNRLNKFFGKTRNSWVAGNFLRNISLSPCLKKLEFGTDASEVPEWLRKEMMVTTNSYSMLSVTIGGKRYPCFSDSAPPLARHALSGDASAFRQLAGDAGQAEIPAGDVALALHVAASMGHVEVARAALLLPRGLEALRAASGSALCPLQESARGGQTLCAGLLLAARANPCNISVYRAAQFNRAAVLELLLAARADANGESNGAIPIIIAAQENSVEALELLLEARGDVNRATDQEETPIHIAARVNNVEALQLLLRARGDVNRADDEGSTPIHVAAAENSADTLKLLLGARGDVESANKYGKTPISIATKAGNAESIKLLQDARS